eukprot:2588228-Rhodomonas_salina.2
MEEGRNTGGEAGAGRQGDPLSMTAWCTWVAMLLTKCTWQRTAHVSTGHCTPRAGRRQGGGGARFLRPALLCSL